MIHEKTTRKRQENRSMKIENRTPHQDGFYMPGEFEPQDGVILIWPKRPGSWPYEAKEAGKVFAEIANKLAGKQKYEDRKQNSASGWILYAGGI